MELSGDPKVSRQDVYAFLPIREYGFLYLIQADWLVNASRGEITRSRWNRGLDDGLVDATVVAAHKFNLDTNLRYKWIRWLPWKYATLSFFETTRPSLLRRLRSENMLENFEGTFRAPHQLAYVPEEYYASDGNPFTLTTSTARTYLSKKYAHADKDIFKALGVTEMTLPVFLAHLQTLMQDETPRFRALPPQWHSELARMLRTRATSASVQPALIALPLLPLRSGEWVPGCRGTDQHIYLPESTLGANRIPNGLEHLRVIDVSAAADVHRNSLFRWLGASELDSLAVCDEIVRTHTSESFNPQSVSNTDLLSHLVFLFNTGWTSPDIAHNLWVISEDGSRVLGRNVYADSDGPHSAQQFFVDERRRFPFLARSFLGAVLNNVVGWHNSLVQNLGIATHPRIARLTDTNTGAFEMHPDFEYILVRHGSKAVLELLKQYWHQYGNYLEFRSNAQPSEPNSSRGKLVARLEQMQVRCFDGSHRRLCKTSYRLRS